MIKAENARNDLHSFANLEKAKFLQRFFKTAPGEYAHGDRFIGVTVPTVRGVAKKYKDLSLSETGKLFKSKVHEERLLALLILVSQYERGDEDCQTRIYRFYFKYLKFVNNWDLVDSSAPQIVGGYLFRRRQSERRVLLQLAKSKSIWDRRVAILSTLYFIRHKDFKDCLKLAKVLLPDPDDLIHKAVGWMLREVGKRDVQVLDQFLSKNCRKMPRTMLRYAIEKHSRERRKLFMSKELK